MKRGEIYIGIFLFISIGVIIYLHTAFDLSEVGLKKIAELQIQSKPYKIGLFYLGGNATTQDGIEVQQLNNKQQRLLKIYEAYNFVNDYKILGDSCLRLVLSDTIFQQGTVKFQQGKADTILLKLP